MYVCVAIGTVVVLYDSKGGPCVHANWFLPVESLIGVWGHKSEMSDFWPKSMVTPPLP